MVDIPIGKEADVMASLAAVGEVAKEFGEEWTAGVQAITADGGPVVRVTVRTGAGEQFAVARELRARSFEALRRGVG